MADMTMDMGRRLGSLRQAQAPREGRALREPGPEIANAITHGIGVLLAIAGLVVLVVKAAAVGPWQVVAYSIFGASMIFLYLASTLYHALSFTRVSRIFEIFDHSAIFVLIAGTYTSLCLTLLRSTSGWWVFGVVWGVAAAGIVLEALFMNRKPALTLALYIAMGWIIVAVWKDFTAVAPAPTVALLFAGGIAYTAGTVFYALGKRRLWFHPVWHLFVLAGTICHFFAALSALSPAVAG